MIQGLRQIFETINPYTEIICCLSVLWGFLKIVWNFFMNRKIWYFYRKLPMYPALTILWFDYISLLFASFILYTIIVISSKNPIATFILTILMFSAFHFESKRFKKVIVDVKKKYSF